MSPNLQETADLVTFTEENLNGKLHFLCKRPARVFNKLSLNLEVLFNEQRCIGSGNVKLTLQSIQT